MKITFWKLKTICFTADSPTAPSTIGSLQSINMDAMLRHTFQPDYSVRAASDVLYMRIKRSLYLAAKRATLMERSQKDTTTSSGDQFDDEVEKVRIFKLCMCITHPILFQYFEDLTYCYEYYIRHGSYNEVSPDIEVKPLFRVPNNCFPYFLFLFS